MLRSRASHLIQLTNISIALLLFSSAAFALCPSDSTESFSISSQNETLTYRYRYQCKNSTWPTVIYLPGGPGSSASEESINFGNSNVIYVDPRGVGLNSSLIYKTPQISSEDLARDVLRIIRQRKLKNYVIYGHSYGTVLATIVASMAEKDYTLSPPKTLILEGTVGHVIADRVQFNSLNKQWKKVISSQTQCITCELDQLANTYSSKTLGALVEASLQESPSGEGLAYFFFGMSPAERLETLLRVQKIVSENSMFSPSQIKLYEQIACNEIGTEGLTQVYYKKGELSYERGMNCSNTTVARPFDSTRWPVKANIVYVRGALDIQTSLEQLQYHAQSQALALKQLVCVGGSGHTAMLFSAGDCKTSFMNAVLQEPFANLAAALTKACSSQVRVTAIDDCIN